MAKMKKNSRMKNCIVPTAEGWQCCDQQSMFMVSAT